MDFASLSTIYYEDSRIIRVGPHGEALYIRSVVFTRRRDEPDMLYRGQLDHIAHGIPAPKRVAAQLVQVGLWELHPEGWVIRSITTRGIPPAVDEAKRELQRRRNRVYQRRHVVFARDGHRCKYCGETANLQVDHVIPIEIGSDDLDNLQTLCRRCNVIKRDRVD